MTRIRFLRLALTLALTGIVAAGCDDSSGPGDDLDGNYSLRTINGAVLPFVLLQFGTQFKAEVTSGQLDLRNDGTFNETLTFRVTEDEVAPVHRAPLSNLSSSALMAWRSTR